MKKVASFTALAASAALMANTASGVEVSVNGGFETGDTSGWADFTPGTVPFTAETPGAFEGTYFGRIENAQSAVGAVVKQANVGVGVINPGDDITISFRAKGTFEAGGVAIAEFFSEVAGGGTSATEILGGQPFFFGTENDWQYFEFDTTAGPDVSGGVTLQFVATTGAASGSTAILDIDDISIDVVPEPSSLALLGLGGLAVMRRRRG